MQSAQRAAQLQARENEQKALSLWIKGATFQQIAAAGFGIATAGGAWRSRLAGRWRGSPSRRPIRRAKHNAPASKRSECCSGITVDFEAGSDVTVICRCERELQCVYVFSW
jgi:hypothetical protein